MTRCCSLRCASACSCRARFTDVADDAAASSAARTACEVPVELRCCGEVSPAASPPTPIALSRLAAADPAEAVVSRFIAPMLMRIFSGGGAAGKGTVPAPCCARLGLPGNGERARSAMTLGVLPLRIAPSGFGSALCGGGLAVSPMVSLMLSVLAYVSVSNTERKGPASGIRRERECHRQV